MRLPFLGKTIEKEAFLRVAVDFRDDVCLVSERDGKAGFRYQGLQAGFLETLLHNIGASPHAVETLDPITGAEVPVVGHNGRHQATAENWLQPSPGAARAGLPSGNKRLFLRAERRTI